MDDDHDLKDFRNVTRLFPLPGVVLFPHAILPLHIFEPRYRQMTEDALASDRFITVVQVRPPSEWTSPTEPTLEEFGCLGRIFQHERLPDGRFNFLLLGRKRVRLVREIPSAKLYRTSEVQVIEDVDPEVSDEEQRVDLIATFRKLTKGSLDPDLDALFETDLPLGVLTDIIAQAIGLPASIKQALLSEHRVGKRAVELLDVLRQVGENQNLAQDETTPSPPPFSV